MSRSLLGRPVRVVKEVSAYAFSGGWGDGWTVLHPGALLRLERQDESTPGLVHFASGPEPIEPSCTGRTGGIVNVSDLDCFMDLSATINRIIATLGEDLAWQWISAPCEALGGEIPRDLLGDEIGQKQIAEYLDDYGHY